MSSWYRGDCHLHTALSSGGELTPAELAAEARSAGLDFIAITDHNTADAHALMIDLAGPDLLVIAGQEMTTDTGHWLAVGLEPGQVVDWAYGVRDGVIDQHLKQVHDAGGLCVAAHPHAPYPSGTFMFPFDGFDLVEVWNGQWASDLPWNADNEAALAEWGRSLAYGVHTGSWRPAIGDSDTHLAGQIGTPQTVVLADDLTVPAILAGMRAGRSWIAGSAHIQLSLTVSADDRTAGIGELLETRGAPARVHLKVEGAPSGTVTVHTERGVAHRASMSADGAFEWVVAAQETSFVRIEVRQSDGSMAALTNPVGLA